MELINESLGQKLIWILMNLLPTILVVKFLEFKIDFNEISS